MFVPVSKMDWALRKENEALCHRMGDVTSVIPSKVLRSLLMEATKEAVIQQHDFQEVWNGALRSNYCYSEFFLASSAICHSVSLSLTHSLTHTRDKHALC